MAPIHEKKRRSWRAIGKDGVTAPANRKTKARGSGRGVRGSETLIISQATKPTMARVPRRPVSRWGARCWTFAIGAAWAHWAVMHRLSAGHFPLFRANIA